MYPCGGRVGVGGHWFFSEVFPAVKFKKSWWCESHAGVAVKRGGGTARVNVLVHKERASLGGGDRALVRPTPKFRFGLDFHRGYSPTVTKGAGQIPPKLALPSQRSVP